jgi:carbon monoxide dehydrogenase subunit G
MLLTDSFTVDVAPDKLWALLTDVEQIAPCVPGFTLKESNHPNYTGRMKVKVGAITLTYNATITFVEQDDEARRVVLSVHGRDVRGPGGMDATVTSYLTGEGNTSTAQMETDVQVTGAVAQFGRGVIADVSSRMTEQFVARLNKQLLAPEPEPAAAAAAGGNGPAPDGAPAATAPVAAEDDEALDLGSVAAMPVLKRLAPAVAGLALIGLVVRLISRRSR